MCLSIALPFPPSLPLPPLPSLLLPSHPFTSPPLPSPLPPCRSTLALMLDTSRESHVTRLSLTLVSPPCERCSLAWSEEELSSVLPLAPHSRCYILLKAHAHFPTHARVLLSDSEVEGEDPGGGSLNTATLDPHRLSYDGSSQSLKPPPVTSTFSKVTRLMDRLRSSSSSKIKGLHSAKSSTMVAKQRYREQTPPISHGSLTMPRSTLQQSVSVTSLRCEMHCAVWCVCVCVCDVCVGVLSVSVCGCAECECVGVLSVSVWVC